MKKIIALALTLLTIFSIFACTNAIGQTLNQNANITNSIDEYSMIDTFIQNYNATAPTPITDTVAINVTDENSEHYRVEFRLGAFQNSIAKTGNIGPVVVDIVNCGWQQDELRIYADGITLKQAGDIVKYAAPIMDPNVPNEDLQDILAYFAGIKSYPDHYFGNLCMTFNEVHGELMLRTD